MAIVANKGNPFEPLDGSFNSPNRSNAGTPVAALVPLFVGDLVLDTTNNKVWKAETMLNSGWVTLTTQIQV